MRKEIFFVFTLFILGVISLSLSSCTKDGESQTPGSQTPGPQTPACGFVQVLTNEVIAGVQFPKGKYQINVFGMTCEEVMGDKGLFSQFLQLGDNDPLPAPWIHLKDAVGAPKFVKSTSTNVGFRVQRVGD
jgi:hypothetical protein